MTLLAVEIVNLNTLTVHERLAYCVTRFYFQFHFCWQKTGGAVTPHHHWDRLCHHHSFTLFLYLEYRESCSAPNAHTRTHTYTHFITANPAPATSNNTS